jgi:hypothetical protein
VVSSRQIERRTYEDVAFRYLAADQHPDHDTIAGFRQTHLSALAGLFLQALRLCEKAGLVKLGHVAIDGTKLQANASKHKAMSYERMAEKERALQAEVEKLLAEAARVDAAEDAQYGAGRRGDELPAELARRESRLKKIAEAKAALEQEARERAVAAKAAAEAKLAERQKQEQRAGEEVRRAAAAGARARAGPTAAEGAAEFHRSGFADHEGRGDEEFRAGLQRAGGGGRDSPGDRGVRGHATSQRQTTIGADAPASGAESTTEAGEGHGR